MPSEVAAGDDLFPAGVGARQPHGGGGRVGTGLEELNALRAWDEGTQPFGKLHLTPTRERRHVALRRGLNHRLRDARLGVSERDGAEGHRAIDEQRTAHVRDNGPARRDEMRGKINRIIAVEGDGALAPRGRAGGKHGLGALAPTPLLGDLRFELFVGLLGFNVGGRRRG